MNESFTPIWYTFRKNDDHVLFYKSEENKMSILEVQIVTELTRTCISNLFPKERLSHYPNGFAKRFRLSRKSMLKNVRAYLQSRKELHSSVFEEIHRHLKKKKNIQPILYDAHYDLDINE